MATINQLVRKPRTPQIAKSNVPALGGMSAEAWCVYPCVYHDTEEAELGAA